MVRPSRTVRLWPRWRSVSLGQVGHGPAWTHVEGRFLAAQVGGGRPVSLRASSSAGRLRRSSSEGDMGLAARTRRGTGCDGELRFPRAARSSDLEGPIRLGASRGKIVLRTRHSHSGNFRVRQPALTPEGQSLGCWPGARRRGRSCCPGTVLRDRAGACSYVSLSDGV